ncbi:MAG: PAS domain S-box protein, partial [Pirellulales bacterium]
MSEVLDFLGGLYNEIDDAVVLASLDAEPLFVNQAGRRLLALAAELDPSETRLEDYYPPDTWKMLREVGLPALKSSGRWAAEGHVKSGSGRVVPVRMTAFLVRHPRAERALYLALVHRDLTDSKRAEEGEALKNAILDSSLDPIIAVDHEGAISEFNKAAEKTFKRSRSEAVGKRPDELLFSASQDGDEQDRVERHVAVGEGSMLGRRTEITAVRSDGEPFPAEMAMTISRLHGLPVFMFFLRDIGERKRAEQALRDSQALYHSLVESLPMTVFRKDLEGRFTFGNRLFCEAMGHSLPELVGKNDFDFFPRELAEKYRRDDQQVMSTGEVLEAVEEYLRPDGTRIYVQTLKGPVRDSEGRLLGTQGMFWDVTARRQAEEALRDSQQRLQSILDNATSVIYVKSLDGRYLLVNRSFETLFHVRRGEVLGKTDYDVFAPRLADAFRANDQKVLQAGRPLEFEEVAPHDDGPHTYISIKFPLADPAGSAHALCGISTDITERKRSEEALGRAKDAAEAANRAKSAFLANMSHEIRTPMNGIIGMTELLLDTQLSAEQHEYLELVKESADSLLSVINDVLDFSKVEAGKLDLEQIGFALRESLGDTMKTLALRAHKKNLELACHIRPEVPEHLVGDPGRLRQVIVNLVGNAIKFTDSGEVVVHVELLSRGSDDVVLHFSIADTGIGVPADKLELIFEAFEQADGSTSRKYGGTGLGLAISSKLVELMGGQIWVESHLGRGSRFHFNAQLLLPAGDALPPPVVEPAAIHDLPVLVVDDNATNRLILEEIL